MVSDEGCNHREPNEDQGAEYQIPDAKDHEDEKEYGKMSQVHPIRVLGNPLGHEVERLIGGTDGFCVLCIFAAVFFVLASGGLS
jgi:hypothetical protein